MKAKDLKNSILQLAIQGKLVPQDPNDEPASKLLEKIRTAKQKLVKEGKIKKDKQESFIYKGDDNNYYEKIGSEVRNITEEIPFEIPDSWEWVRLGNLFSHNTGKALNSKEQTGKLLSYITTSNLYWDEFVLDNLKSMYFKDSEIAKCTVTKGDLLVCEGGDIGRAAIWDYPFNMRIQNHIHRLRPYVSISLKFYYYVFYYYKHSHRIGGKGIAIQGLSSNAIHQLLIPIPPLKEQEHIVKRLRELEPYIEDYEKTETELSELNETFPEQIKKSILQYAIQGKLVPQDPSDEPASILLEKIKAEKQKLIKVGKIKKDKVESYIYKRDNRHYEKIGDKEVDITDEIPFEIPDNWVWCRSRDLFSLEAGLSFKKDLLSIRSSNMIRILRGGNIEDNFYSFYDNDLFISREFVKKDIYLKKNWLITPAVTSIEQIGKIARITQDYSNVVVGGFVLNIIPHFSDDILSKILLNFMLSSYYNQSLKGITHKSGQAFYNLSKDKMSNLLFPLPPLEEQKRIVDKLEQIFEIVS